MSDEKIPHATPAWFSMVGALICNAVVRAALPPDFRITFLERFTDGAILPGGYQQGLHLTITGGQPIFRAGVRPGERADVTMEVTRAGSYAVNTLYSADPALPATFNALVASGELRIDGDLSRLGEWLGAVHDPIVDRTL
ncbi:hypothetical protein [Novosphingobium colocasiae]|uniref:hypothetical protein n=1 Tax=Novosphingobium colocasiae TaxID=1256513 RepID=UPI0035B2D010